MYTHTTWLQLRQQLAARLRDTGNVFWLDAENTVYLTEALRTWGSFAAYWRERGSFVTAANTIYYDIPTQLSSLAGYTVTDRNLVNAIQYHLLEAVNDWSVSTTWGGTEQFTMADVVNAIQRRRNQLLLETGAVVTQQTVNVPAPPISRVPLADTVIDVRRVVWRSVTDVYTVLWRSDEWEAFAITPDWMQNPASPPSGYSTIIVPPLTVQIIPPPLDAGRLDMINVVAPASLDVSSGVLMNIPDDFSWVVKWGALADLLGREGISSDPARAEYCERRWREGVELLKLAPSILQVEVNDVPVWSDSLANLDGLSYGWMNATTAQSGFAGIAGSNLIALSPIPNGVYGITVDLVRNVSIPAADGTFVQIGREHLDVILDYAQHLAAFKQGGDEFGDTVRAYENLVRAAADYNDKLLANSVFAVALGLTSQREEEKRPYRTTQVEGRV